MDKFVNLCWECRELLRKYYRLDAYDEATAIPGDRRPVGRKRQVPACENCGERYGLKVCRVRSK